MCLESWGSVDIQVINVSWYSSIPSVTWRMIDYVNMHVPIIDVL
jgi:hypothetical protein